jgi:FYVE, RhoGEF and PH domain containing 5/6
VRVNANPSSLMALQTQSGSPSRMDAIRRSKARPLSHPVIPHIFVESLENLNPGTSDHKPGVEPASFDSSSDSRQLHPQSQPYEDPSRSVLSLQTTNPGDADVPTAYDELSPRTRKRFSMPAIALQTTPVTALPRASGEGRSKRFSLVLGHNGRHKASIDQAKTVEGSTLESGASTEDGESDLRRGVAAVKLQELLGRVNDARI